MTDKANIDEYPAGHDFSPPSSVFVRNVPKPALTGIVKEYPHIFLEARLVAFESNHVIGFAFSDFFR